MSKTWSAGFVAVVVGLTLPWGGVAEAAERTGAEQSAEKAGKAESKAESKADTKADKKAEKSRKRAMKTEPGEERKASVVKHGWWWTANEPPPETGLLAAPQPPTPTTPNGTLAVGALGGDPERIAAIEVALKAKPGSEVRSFDMVLRESAQPGANVNAEGATILACPVVELFWADGNAAAWKDRPEYDCEIASAKGTRDETGLWHFDLSDIAATWLAEDNADSRSVVLVEGVDAPEGFQVAFDGRKLEGIGLALKATPPTALPDPDDSGTTTSGSTGSGVSSGGSSGGSSGSSGGFGSSDSGSLGGGEPSLIGGPDPQAGGEPQAAPPAAEEQVGMIPVAGTPAWYSGIPRTGLLLVPFALGLAYLIMLALGPDGRPLPATGRHGVSRALDRLRQVRPGGVAR